MTSTFPNAVGERIAGPEPRPDAIAELSDVGGIAELLGCSSHHVYRLSDAERMVEQVPASVAEPETVENSLLTLEGK